LEARGDKKRMGKKCALVVQLIVSVPQLAKDQSVPTAIVITKNVVMVGTAISKFIRNGSLFLYREPFPFEKVF
jgi:hypothetical protein